MSLGNSRLVELINGASDIYIKSWMLQVLLMYAEQPLIDEVFDALKPSNRFLKDLQAVQTWLACLNNSPTFSGKLRQRGPRGGC